MAQNAASSESSFYSSSSAVNGSDVKPWASDSASTSTSLEQQIVDRICPKSTVEEVKIYVPKIIKIDAEQLDKQTASIGDNLAMTHYKCESCGNADQVNFAEDRRHGQVTCTICGTVAQDHQIHDGAWKRQFTGEVNPSFHGPAPDPRFSSGHNLRTNMSLGSGEVGVGGTKITKKELRDLKNAQNDIEMNLTRYANADAKRTREGYKDKQKTEAFKILDDVCFSLQLHESVNQRSKQLFAAYRDSREQLQALKRVEAACLITAYYDIMAQGLAVKREKLGLAQDVTAAPSSKRQKGVMDTLPKKPTYEQLHPFMCKVCQRRFNNKKMLRIHSKEHNKNTK
uniref:C2H2-type domain-containing protein n=1 Tax=Aplanochytrium stocchinoi TaxID=215587 RepID=A0A7S3PQ86_9STRA|mmetsp:Transcript_8505/g.9679  ORF Transcript_8505/g.9679 Transcript_8505/m.9679 type:complete len:341 (+) Transcript_8505:103-1125(+)|eukprot:CAMPEP_0204839920 /NCGR_PEP_ID=MMETSP1346-20131115/35811_1 /ASSEMBLY_ACC=CAM_ASM_000771 /TAXON_ID=215587 /ORGANISM="Aplanochytrium stocchinoi, Strain GSBS06" /LENGTH=340 /DNA_ID=CAMNT_0051976989 /DNA_START=269 /DNA_END=1291 /DNA_ORIENTATION=+